MVQSDMAWPHDARPATPTPTGRRFGRQPAGAPGTIVTACRPGGDSARMQRLGTLYRGREGMWTWVLHRISGVAILFYLFAHVTDQALINVSPEAYNRVMNTYRNPVVGLLELGLAVLIIFHALNGLRIILFDFWSKGIARQRQMLWLQTVLFVLLATPAAVG